MHIYWLDEVTTGQLPQLGGKGANLARLTQWGFNVPTSFCIDAAAYQQFIDTEGIAPVLQRGVAGLDGSDLKTLNDASERLRDAFVAPALSSDLEQEILVAYRALSERLGVAEPLVSVRSSATAEDTPGTSFAGQYDSYLGVRGESELLKKVKKCWASLWNAQAIHYRSTNGLDHLESLMAVVVQQMVPSESAGVLFTANPVSNDYQEVLINSSWGLGESVVQGLVVPDSFFIDKESRVVTSRTIPAKESTIELGDGSGTRQSAVPQEMRDRPSLTDEQLDQLLDLALSIEDRYEAPQDIEWAYADGQLYVLQSRPITSLDPFPIVWADPSDSDHEWPIVTMTTPAPYLPMDESVRAIHGATRGKAAGIIGGPPAPLARVFNGYVYARLVPVDASKEEMEKRSRAFTSELEGYWARGETIWEKKYFPDLDATNKRLKAFDLRAATDGELRGHLLEVIKEYERYWVIHWMRGGGQLREQWLETYRTYTGIDDDIKALTLSIEPNTSTFLVQGLVGLADLVKVSPALSTLFATHTPAHVLSSLDTTPDGTEFHHQLTDFINVFGYRAGSGFGSGITVSTATWLDDPTIVLQLISRYLPIDTSTHSQVEEASQQERERLLQEAFEAMGSDSDQRKRFLHNLNMARKANTEQEDHNFHLDNTISALQRLAILEIADRLVSSEAIQERDDVFYLTLDEVLDALQGSGHGDFHWDVRARKVQHKIRLNMTPPAVVGGSASPLTPSADVHSPAMTSQTVSLRGVPASAGSVTGTARVIGSGDLVPDIKPGEILVAHNAGPLWTPLFPVIGGLVLNEGAVLLHAAVVAREYKIPAVMQTRNATDVIVDGQTITVDGTNGVVHLE